MPISPRAKPRPSTSATITEAPEVVATEELVAAETQELENSFTASDTLTKTKVK